MDRGERTTMAASDVFEMVCDFYWSSFIVSRSLTTLGSFNMPLTVLSCSDSQRFFGPLH